MDTQRRWGRGSQTITETSLSNDQQHTHNRLTFKNVPRLGDKFTQRDTAIDSSNHLNNLEKPFDKNYGEDPKNDFKDVIAKIAELGLRGMNALAQFPFSPHPLGWQDSEIGDAQLTQSDHETRLMNHGLAFQFQDALRKAASFHFADSEAFQKAKDLALGNIAKIDNVQRKKKYLLEILGGKTILDVDEPLKECLETIKELKTDTPVKLSMSKLKIKAYADNINKQAEGIKNKLRSISETKQFIETLIKHVGASKPLETLKRNLETYENVLESATELEEKFSKSIKNVFNSNSPHKIVDLKALETDAKELINARGALSAFNKDYTSEQKNAVKQAFNEYINYLQQETQDKFAESTKQIEKIEQEFNEKVQAEAKAAEVAHLTLERFQARNSINATWMDVREINSFNFTKEGQTTVTWRPDISKVELITQGSEGKSENLVDELYAKRLAKVEKEMESVKCTFEIPDNTFSKFDTHTGRSRAILTTECIKDPSGKESVNQDCCDRRIMEIEQIKQMQKTGEEPKIDCTRSKVVKNLKGEDINEGITKKTYLCTSGDEEIKIIIEEDIRLTTRTRGDHQEQIMEKTVNQTQEHTFTKGTESKTHTLTRTSKFTQTTGKDNFISKEQTDFEIVYRNGEQIVKKIRNMPTEALKSIKIKTSTKPKLLSELEVEVRMKTLPDSPIIYHSEVRSEPVEVLKQSDRINLDAQKLILRNGRVVDLNSIDYLKTQDPRTSGIATGGLVFQLTGPTRSCLVPVNYAGDENLFTQQNKNKEDELIRMLETNRNNHLKHLKESILLASNSIGSDTFNPETLRKAFATAEMCDNEVNRQIALSKEMVMKPPENRNDLAQLMKSREVFQRDGAMPETVDGNSEQTRKMTEDAKNFCGGLVDAITNPRKETELRAQIVVDRQGLEKLVAYDEYNHALSLVDNKILGLIDEGKKILDSTDPVTKITEVSGKVKDKILALTADMNGKITELTTNMNGKIIELTTKTTEIQKELQAPTTQDQQPTIDKKKKEEEITSLTYRIKESQKELQQLTNYAENLNVLVKYERNPETATSEINELTAALTKEGATKLKELSKTTERSKLPEETKKLIHDEHMKLLNKITKEIDSENIEKVTETLNKIKKNREYIEKGNKFIEGVKAHANQIEDVMHLISNMKKIEVDIDNSSDLYAKNWLNLKRAKAAADHNQFHNMGEAEVSKAILDKKIASHHKNWLIIRNAIEDRGIKGANSYILSLKAPTLSEPNSLKRAREASECSWVQYLGNVATQVARQAHSDYTPIKVALSKAEYIRQYIDKNEKVAQAVISLEVSAAERQKQMLDAMQDIDETFLLTPTRPKWSKDSLASMQSQKDDNYTFNPDRLKNKSPEQLSKELRVLTGKDLEYAMRDVGKLIEQTDDPILKEIYRKNAPKMALAMAKSASELRKQLIEIQDWWQRLPELKKQQRRNFLMSLIEATILQVTNGQRYVNDGLGKINGSVVKGIVG